MTAPAWAIHVTRRSTDTDGVLHLEADVLDGTARQGVLQLHVTPDRALTILWTQEPDTAPVTIASAWSTA